MPEETAPAGGFDVDQIRHGLETDGVIAQKGAFDAAWVQRVREDIDAAFEEARSREGGAVGRGPNRWYVEIHPEALRGFVELVEHPWVRTVCETMLGPDYQVVESWDVCKSKGQKKIREFNEATEPQRKFMGN